MGGADGEDTAPGWDAIDTAIASVVGTVTPAHFGTGTGLPNQDGVWGISAYDLGTHWFLVTYGLSELFTKQSDDAEVSGWGEELTMNTAPGADVPRWAVGLLARLGELVFQRGTPFLPGTHLEFPSAPPPIPPAVCWVEDARLGTIPTVHGRLQFVQTVALAPGEVPADRDTSSTPTVERIREADPLLTWPRT